MGIAFALLTLVVLSVVVLRIEGGRSAGVCREAAHSSVALTGVVPSRIHPGRLYASTGSGHLYVSSDGFHWKLQSRSVPGPLIGVAGKTADILLASGSRGLFASKTSGRTWEDWLCQTDVSAVAVGSSGRTIYVGGQEDVVGGTSSGGLFRTADAGEGWKHLQTLSSPNINAIATYGKTVLVATEAGGVDESLDSGQSFGWRTVGPASIGFPHGLQLTSFALVRVRRGVSAWAGTRLRGVWRMTNGGRSWRAVGLDGDYIDSLSATGAPTKRVYAVTARTLMGASIGARFVLVWSRIAAPRRDWSLAGSDLKPVVYAWGGNAILEHASGSERWTPLAAPP